jgi:hypothetical protein
MEYLPLVQYDFLGDRLRDLIHVTSNHTFADIKLSYSPIGIGKLRWVGAVSHDVASVSTATKVMQFSFSSTDSRPACHAVMLCVSKIYICHLLTVMYLEHVLCRHCCGVPQMDLHNKLRYQMNKTAVKNKEAIECSIPCYPVVI